MGSAATDVETVESLPAGLRQLGAAETADRQCRKSGDKLVFRAAAKAPEFFDHLCAHFRETRRTAVDIPCEVRVMLTDGTLFDSGTGAMRDVSPSGALLESLKLDKGCLPARPFKLALVLKGTEYKGVGIEATPVRFVAETAGLGVRFDEIFVTV